MRMCSLIQLVINLSIMTLALLVMIGWITKSPMLVQIHPSFVPMQFNTALGFMMIGSALLCIHRSKRTLGIITASMVTALGAMTILQYSLGINLGIDQLFIRPAIGVDENFPGRTGANTAFCFVIVGSIILRILLAQQKRCCIVMVSGIVFVLSAASLWGYISNLPGLYGWGEVLSGMAVHTAIGFSAVSASLLLYAMGRRSHVEPGISGLKSPKDTLFTPISVAVPILVLSVCVWQAMKAWERSKLETVTNENSVAVMHYLERNLENRFSALHRMGERWAINKGTNYDVWKSDAANYVEDLPGVGAVEWIDRTNHVRWVEPLEGNEGVVGMYSSFDTTRESARSVSLQKHLVYATRTIELVQGGKGFLVYVPLVVEGEHDGFMLCVIHLRSFLEHTFHQTVFQHEILVRDAGEIIYSTESNVDQDRYHADSVPLDLAGIEWDIQLRPTSQMIKSHASAWPEAILFIGSLFAIGVGVLVKMLQSGSLVREKLEHLVEEIQRKQVEIQDKNAELSRSNKEMESFTYTVSHDLKSPLVTIDGYLGFLRLDIEQKRYDRVDEFSSRIERATKRMGDTISDLLELSRVGRETRGTELVHTRELVDEVIAMLESQIRESDIEIVISSQMPTIQGDRTRISQVFQNLITNAISYSKHPDHRCVITIDGVQEGDEVRLSVSDNGMGIPHEFQEKIFGLFQRLDTGVDGTGIGLAIVSRIANMHGGKAWVESTPGKGATFFVTMKHGIQQSHHLDRAA